MTLVPELRIELQDAADRHVSRDASRWPAWSRVPTGRALLASSGVALCTIVVVAVLLVVAEGLDAREVHDSLSGGVQQRLVDPEVVRIGHHT